MKEVEGQSTMEYEREVFPYFLHFSGWKVPRISLKWGKLRYPYSSAKEGREGRYFPPGGYEKYEYV